MARSRVSRDERGMVTLWVLGLCVSVMFLGGIGLDLWRTVAVRRELSSIADAAATAGASAVDVGALRQGDVVLDQEGARSLAVATIDEHREASSLESARVDVGGDEVTVILRDDVSFSLLRIFMGGDEFVVQVHASAEPRELP
jgi:hypothetical protein